MTSMRVLTGKELCVCVCVYLQVLVLGHDGDLVAVHTEDFSLQVDQLSLTNLHVITGLQVVFPLLTCTHTNTITTRFHLWLLLKRKELWEIS